MAEPIGYATLQVIPSMQGIEGAIGKSLTGPFSKAGTAAGKDFASGVKKSASDVKSASDQLAKLRDKEADAAGKVRVAEAQLNALRERGVTDQGRLTAATEKRDAAQRKLSAAQRDTTAATETLTNAEREASEETEGLGRKSLLTGDNLAKLGAIAGTAFVAAGAALFKLGSSFADMQNTIRVGTGATGDDLNGLVDIAKGLGSQVPASFDEIGSTVADLNTRLGLTGQPLETLSRQFLELQNMGIDADINTVSQAFSGFGVTGEDTSRQLDELFQISQATGLSVNDLAQSAVKAGPQLRGFGFSMGESAALVGQLDKSGLDADRTLQTMSRAMQSFASEGRDGKEALLETVDQIEQFVAEGDKAGALDMAGKIFGTRGAGQFVDAVQSGTLSVSDLIAATGATGDTIIGVAEETRTFSEQWEMFKNDVLAQLEPVATRVFGILTNAMGWIADNAVPALQSMGEWIGRNSGLLKTLGVALGVVVIGLTATSIAQKAVAAGGFLKFIATAVTSTRLWTGAQQLLNLALTNNPIGRIIMIVTALAAAVVVAYQNSETFRNIVQAAWNGIKAAVASVWGWLSSTVFPALQAALRNIGSVAMWLWNNAINPAFKGIGAIIGAIWAVVRGYFTVWMTVMRTVADVVLWLWNNAVTPAFNAIGSVIGAVWGGIISPALDGFIDVLQWVGDKAMWLWQNVMIPAWDAIKNAISTVWNFIKPILDNIGRGIQAVGDIASRVGDAMRNAFDGVVDVLKAPIHMIGGLLAGLPDRIGIGSFAVDIPGISTLKSWGQTLQNLREGGTIDANPGGFVVNAAASRMNASMLRALGGQQITGPGSGTSDSILAMGANGDALARVSNGEFYFPPELAIPLQGVLSSINSGGLPALATGGGLEPYGLPTGTSISYGSPGFPDWVTKLGDQHNVKPSTYPGHQEGNRSESGFAPNPNRLNRGIDWSGPVPAMQAFADYLLGAAPNEPGLEQIIWQNPGTGQKVGWAGRENVSGGSYYSGDYGGHQDHVHTRHAAAWGATAVPAVPDTVTETPTYQPPELGATPDYQPPTSTAPETAPPAGPSTGTSERQRLKTFKELGSDAGGILAEGLIESLGLPSWVGDPNELMGDDGSNVRTTDSGTTGTGATPQPQGIAPGPQIDQSAPAPIDPSKELPPIPEQPKRPQRSNLTGPAMYAYEIARAAIDSGLDRAAAVIGEATALVEAGDPLKMWANNSVPESLNYPHDSISTDYDSVGLFQQRDNGAWGTVAQRMDPHASATMFYEALKKVPGWQTMDPGAAAQAVQRSAFPGKYSQKIGRANELVDQTALFDTGGIWQPGTFGFNGLNEPELVLKKNQWGVIADQTAAVKELARERRTGREGGLNVTVYGNTAGDIVTEFRREEWRGAGGYGSRGR